MKVWENLEDRWPVRARLAAALVRPGASVIDIGAGAQGLRGALHPSCTYTPSDIFPRSPDCVYFDINSDAWPEGHWDVAVMLGVLEHAEDLGLVIWRLHWLADRVVTSFWHARRHVSEDDFAQLARDAGWEVRKVLMMYDRGIRGQVIWVLS